MKCFEMIDYIVSDTMLLEKVIDILMALCENCAVVGWIGDPISQ